MKGNRESGAMRAQLRKLAERMLDTGQYEPDALEAFGSQSLEDLVQELHIYHAELEIQNEHLRRAQQELERVSLRYQSLFDLAPVGYVILDKRGRIVEANQQARDSFDESLRGNLLGTDFSIYLAPSDRMAWQRHLQACLSTAQGRRCEVKLRSKGDPPRYVLLVSKVLPDHSEKNERRILLSITDITRRKQSELRLERLKNQFESFMEHLPAGAFVRQGADSVLFVNRFLRRQFGASPCRQDDPGKLAEDPHGHRRLLEARQDELLEPLEIRDVHGNKRFLQCICFPIALPDQEDIQGGILLDVTRLQETESRRRAMERQLRQSMKLESIGRLAGGMAHDFNNQLTVIQGYCEMLTMSGRLSDQARRQLREVGRAANRAHALTDQLLSFSRRQILMPETTDVHSLLQSMLPEIRAEVGADIQVQLDQQSCPPIEIDRGQFRQAICCLVRNARDAGASQLRLRTGTRRLEEEDLSPQDPARPGQFLFVEVQDDGCGIEKSVISNIFEPFFTTRKVGQGVGLGLSMVHGFALQSGGKVDVESTSGLGSTFRIYLPLESRTHTWDPLLPGGDLPRGAETLLLVHPDPRILAMLTARLREMGYRVLEACDTNEALRLAGQEETLDLLVASEELPEADPEALADRLKPKLPSGHLYTIAKFSESSARSHENAGIVRKTAMGIRHILDGISPGED